MACGRDANKVKITNEKAHRSEKKMKGKHEETIIEHTRAVTNKAICKREWEREACLCKEIIMSGTYFTVTSWPVVLLSGRGSLALLGDQKDIILFPL